MAFKMYKNLDFSRQQDMSASGNTNYFKEADGHEETHYGIICLQCDKASYLGKKLLLPGLLDNVLYELGMEDTQKSDC